MSQILFDTPEQLAQGATDAFCDLAQAITQSGKRFRVALSGGSTPKRMNQILADRDLPWDQIDLFWGDERNVPHDHADSNYRMVCDTLLDALEKRGIKPGTYPVPVDVEDPAKAALAYESLIKQYLTSTPVPQFDLVLLGMGDDVHTASLFPGTKALEAADRLCVENWVEKLVTWRYTLTAEVINAASETWFVIAGAGKREAVRIAQSKQPNDPSMYPSQLIKPTRWLLTRDVVE
ncbi:MAG: 6-phosphogluconolactonase [Planctomycetota bacterium]